MTQNEFKTEQLKLQLVTIHEELARLSKITMRLDSRIKLINQQIENLCDHEPKPDSKCFCRKCGKLVEEWMFNGPD